MEGVVDVDEGEEEAVDAVKNHAAEVIEAFTPNILLSLMCLGLFKLQQS